MTESPYPHFRILLVDDEQAWLRSVSLILARAGITNTATCTDSRAVMEILAAREVGLVLLDLTMPHLSGEELLTRIAEQHPEITTIVVSGMNQIETAVRCMKLGAYDYFVKTVEEDRLVQGVMRAIRMHELERENRAMSDRLLSGGLRNPKAFSDIVTSDPAMHAIFSYVEAVAPSPQPLLITGDSGVGKELVARAVHKLSGRSGQLVSVNVAGLDDNVFSDTLFGHLRGAFTGADQPRRGMIEEAAEGTLFLDEIGDLSIASQVKLLRLLQEGEYFPLGSDRPKRLNARIIVATHQNLTAKEAAGQFRRDLYYRLRTHRIKVPPLKERLGDIPLLVEYFLHKAAHDLGKKKPTPPRELFQLLASYSFPGNVRELRAMIYDAVSVHRDRVLSLETFIDTIGSSLGASGSEAGVPVEDIFKNMENLPSITDSVGQLIVAALERADGNQTIAARLLGISQPALSKRLSRKEPV
jgi:DNA-binding NtrC family response regulator